ncbi:polar amino acid ABC transporter, inner membrane subunit (plasmid) [Rhizobium leguminosarum bv. trifolii WSM2304]|uniref:Polar amino acid ABC transporter, inner membrane subunit n=1 Tax=Rhizobium leguminosarum bv. trifolii (strain WSM2304) TaxID=395492 RepID=A0ABF7QZJ1_RHILW|nr:amino acid ABC transporter permease [Rhizobium leguminosarum]ACI59708.1 polar amino acid ABC transporter, inner membrane subunit [Rhizobium leguminosarum bv. trifolii WSM2304]
MTGVGEYFPLIAKGLSMTFLVAVTCFALGAILALPVSFARLSENGFARAFASTFISVVRGVPPITWLFLIFYGLPQLGLKFSSLSAAVVGLTMMCTAYIAEFYRSGWLAMPAGQIEAAKALGLTEFAAFRKVIAPQVFVIVLPMAITYFIALLKNSAVVSVIGVSDVTDRALSESRSAPDPFNVFIAAGFVYMAVSVPIGLAGRFTSPWVARRFGMA